MLNQIRSDQSVSCVQLFATPWTAACPGSSVSTVSQSLLKFMSIESVMLSNHLILCCPLLILPSVFPSIKVFSDQLALCISGQSVGASTSVSVFPMNIWGWFPLGLIGLISLQSKELSRDSPSQFEIINLLLLSLLYGPTLTWLHDYTKTIALTIWIFVSKVIYLLFNRLSSLSWLSFQGTSVF